MVLAVVLRLGERLSPRPNAILGRLSRRLWPLVSESAVSGGLLPELLLPLPKLFERADGMKEKRLEDLLLFSVAVFLRLKEKEVLRESVDRRGSGSVFVGMACFMLTGGCDRGGFSFGVSDFSLPPKREPRLPKSSPSVLDRLWPRLLEALLFGSFTYGSEALES